MGFQELVQSGRLGSLSPSAWAVLMSYFAHADAKGEAWPGQKSIAEQFGLTDRSVRRGRDELIDARLVEILDPGSCSRPQRVRLLLRTAVSARPDSPVRNTGQQCPENSVRELNQRTDDDDGEDAPGPDEGLFDRDDAIERLVATRFGRRDARRLVGRYGAGPVIATVDHVAAMARAGTKIRSPKGLIVHMLSEGKTPSRPSTPSSRTGSQGGGSATRDVETTSELTDAELASRLLAVCRTESHGDEQRAASQASRALACRRSLSVPEAKRLVAAVQAAETPHLFPPPGPAPAPTPPPESP